MQILLAILIGVLAIIPSMLFPAHRVGATATWVHTTGTALYDTPSGNFDDKFYIVNPDNSLLVHAPTSTSATTTVADGFYPATVVPVGYIQAHVIGKKYIDYFSDGTSQLGSATIDGSLSNPNATIPIEGGVGTIAL